MIRSDEIDRFLSSEKDLYKKNLKIGSKSILHIGVGGGIVKEANKGWLDSKIAIEGNINGGIASPSNKKKK